MKTKAKTTVKDKTTMTAKDKNTVVKTKESQAAARVVDVDPLADLPLTNDFQSDVNAEADLMKQALREADKRNRVDWLLKNDTEYWFCVVFEDRNQKEQFLTALNWLMMGDKYLDGTLLARQMNIPLKKSKLRDEKPNMRKVFTDLVDSSLTDPDLELD